MFQVEGVVDGVRYTLGFNKGRVEQLYSMIGY